MTLGLIQANCFILGCRKTREAVVVDPGDEPERILVSLAKNDLNLKYIINTHGHFDHIGGNKKLKEITEASIMIHDFDRDLLRQSSNSASTWGIKSEETPSPDIILQDGEIVKFGLHELKIIHTPGHTKGGISIYSEFFSKLDTKKNKKVLFVGDTLFAGSIGRTDLPGGNLKVLLSSIHNKLFTFDDDVVVYPGHMHSTTIGKEKLTNPFCGLNL